MHLDASLVRLREATHAAAGLVVEAITSNQQVHEQMVARETTGTTRPRVMKRVVGLLLLLLLGKTETIQKNVRAWGRGHRNSYGSGGAYE